MLNKLYGVMDYLAGRFGLFKVETIGDAYVCCSGLPDSDENHAVNVANFALAVQHCCRAVRSPLDGSPIQLRVGINSGSCASGIVGVTNPRYCVFGDTVNTTARHENTGEPGRVHCSLTTMIELQGRAEENFRLISRGMVEMKGKGELPTYWLEATEKNTSMNEEALMALDEAVAKLINKTSSMKSSSSPVRQIAGKTLSLVEQMKEAKAVDQPRYSSLSPRNEDSESMGYRSQSSSSSTPSRKELAKLLSRRSSGEPRIKRPSRRSERRSRADMAKDGIDGVLQVVEKAEEISASGQ